MCHPPSRSRRNGVASLATLAAVAALSVATPTALTGTARAAAPQHRGGVVAPVASPQPRHSSMSLPGEGFAAAVAGTVYLADTGNGRVVAVAPDGSESTFGTGWSQPYGVAVDASGDVFVADGGLGAVVEVTPDGTQTTVASGFGLPVGVAVDESGTVFVSDAAANKVVRVDTDGTQTVLPFTGLSCPNGIAVDAQGDVLAANYCGNTVSELAPNGTVSTVGTDLASPTGVTVDTGGTVFVAEYGHNQVTRIAGDGTQSAVAGSDTGAPTGTEVDQEGNVYIADISGGAYRVATDATRTTIAGDVMPYDVAVVDGPPVTPQQITFTSKAPKRALPGDAYTVRATGGDSGNPVRLSTLSDDVCTVSDNADGTAEVSLAHSGDCVIDADQAGDEDYAPAEQAHQTVSVARFGQSVTLTSPAPADALPGDGYTVSATGGDSGNPVTFSTQSSVCSVSDHADGSAQVSLDHAGDCVIDADQAGSGDFSAAEQVHQTVAVGLFSQQVSFTSTPGAVRVGDTYPATATGGDSDEPVTFALAPGSPASCTVSPTGQVHLLHAMSCWVEASQAGDQDHAAGSAVQHVTVLRARQTVTFTTKAPRHPEVGATYHAAATGNPNGRPVHLTAVGACSIGRKGLVRFTQRGTCSVIASQAGSADLTRGRAKQVMAVAAAKPGRGPVHPGMSLLG